MSCSPYCAKHMCLLCEGAHTVLQFSTLKVCARTLYIKQKNLKHVPVQIRNRSALIKETRDWLHFRDWYSVLRRGKLIQFHSGLVRDEDSRAKAALISHISVTINCISDPTKANHFLLHHTQTPAYCMYTHTNTHALPVFRKTLISGCPYLSTRCTEKWLCMRVVCTVSCLMSPLKYLRMTGRRYVS